MAPHASWEWKGLLCLRKCKPRTVRTTATFLREPPRGPDGEIEQESRRHRRSESVALRTYWVLVIMDQYTRGRSLFACPDAVLPPVGLLHPFIRQFTFCK